MEPNDPRHGTEAGFEQHIRDSEDPCAPCIHGDLIAARRRWKRKAMGHEFRRKLGQRLHDTITRHLEAGATYDDIALWTGLSSSQAWRIYHDGPEGYVYARTWLRIAEMRPQPVITPVGITRRIRALTFQGFSAYVIADEAGVDYVTIAKSRARVRSHMNRDTKAKIAAAYDRLWNTTPEGATQQLRAGITRAQNMARAKGWAPAAAWDEGEIDNPQARPHGHLPLENGSKNDLVDHAVVQRLLAGEKVRSTRAEKEAAMTRWLASGRPERLLCDIHGWKSGRYVPRDDEGDAA